MKERQINMKQVLPNGGWGWVVVAAVAIINMFNQSILSVFGLMFGDHLNSMGEETVAAALITNLNSLMYNFSGFLIGPAIKTLSPKIVVLIGCVLTSFGLMICSFSYKLWHMIIGYSFLAGIGLGLIAPSTFMAINMYFDKKKGRAVGFAMAGSGIGQMIIPHMVRILLDNYGFRITVNVMAVLSFIGIFGCLTFKPLKIDNRMYAHKNMNEVNLLCKMNEKQDIQIKIIPASDINAEKTKHYSDTTNTANPMYKNILHKLSQAMDLELLKDPIFWSIIIGMALTYTATFNFSMLFPYFLQISAGLSRTDTASCMTAIAGADIIFRLLLPIITEKLQCSFRGVFLFGAIGMLVCRSIIAESVQFSTLLILSGFYGVMKSATVINNNLTISDHCEPDKLAGGLGLNMISKGVIVITIGQLLGWLRDYTGSYSFCLHAQNILLAIVILFWLPELIYKFYKEQKQNSLKENNDANNMS